MDSRAGSQFADGWTAGYSRKQKDDQVFGLSKWLVDAAIYQYRYIHMGKNRFERKKNKDSHYANLFVYLYIPFYSLQLF